MQSVTSNAVALAFKGMKVVECGKIDPNREVQDNWYIKYDCGLIEEWFTQSGVLNDLSQVGNIYSSFNKIVFPIPLKSGTQALSFEMRNQCIYGQTPVLWFGTTNDQSDSNTQQAFSAFSFYRYTNMGGINVRCHLVGFWK